MAYDFTTLIDRSTVGSEKWNDMLKRKPSAGKGIAPFSVADMELKTPPELVEGLKEFLDSSILGYAEPTDAYYDAICGWMRQRHCWQVEKEWIVETDGVVSALFSAVLAFSKPGDGVIVMPPVYYPFYLAVESNHRRLVASPLVDRGDSYEIDFDNLEAACAKPENTLLILCSPHNPVGRVWSRRELEQVAALCLKHGVFVIADEIHFDLIMPGSVHTVFARLGAEVADNCIVATAPSKTFNLAGLQDSNIIIPEAKARKRFLAERHQTAAMSNNILAYGACILAYRRCSSWLDELISHLYGNYCYLRNRLARDLPEVKVYPMEGTYLAWLDFRAWGMDEDALERFMISDADLFFSVGSHFGVEGKGFERMNLACPRQTLEEALDRLVKAAEKRSLQL